MDFTSCSHSYYSPTFCLNRTNSIVSKTHSDLDYLMPGPQKEIFPGGTKIDAGPPKFSETLTDNLVPFFAQN